METADDRARRAAQSSSERGAALRSSATPVVTGPIKTVDHDEVVLDEFDFDDVTLEPDEDAGGYKAAEAALVPKEDRWVNPHEAYVQAHCYGAKGAPGTTVTLAFPLSNGVKEIFVRRPKVTDLLRISSNSNNAQKSDAVKELALFALLTELAGEELGQLYDFDYRSIQHAYRGFSELPPLKP